MIQRTLALLHEALGSLIREKPYDRISVTETLDRAKVSRSTFYIHFRDKDELLTSSMRALLLGVPILRRRFGHQEGQRRQSDIVHDRLAPAHQMPVAMQEFDEQERADALVSIGEGMILDHKVQQVIGLRLRRSGK